jgi:hypothetical protein
MDAAISQSQQFKADQAQKPLTQQQSVASLLVMMYMRLDIILLSFISDEPIEHSGHAIAASPAGCIHAGGLIM